ncbi:MAG: MFS transporter [Candidatus Promineifilaceae bacterium]
METPVEEKLDFKRILPIIFIIFVDLMGLTILIPVLPYYALSFNAGPATIGLLGAAYPLMQLLGGPVLGSLSDRFGRKPVLAVAQVGTFLSLLMLGFSNALWLIFLARVLDGITGANIATVQSAIADVTTPKTRSQGLGLVGAAFGLGFIIGPVISGLALALSGSNYSAPAFVASGFAFVSIILTTFVFQETLPPEKRNQSKQSRGLSFGRISDGLRNPVIGTFFLLLLLQQTVFGAFQLMFAPFTLNRLGLNSVGNVIVFVLFGIISVVVQGGLIRKLTDRFGERRLIISGLSSLALGLFLMGLTPQLAVPWYSQDALIEELQQGQETATTNRDQLALLPETDPNGISALIFLLMTVPLVGFGTSVVQPSVNSLLTQSVSPQEIGATLGLGAAFLSLGNVVGPLWGGAAFDFIAPGAPFMIGGVVIAMMVPLAIRRVRLPE